MPLSQTEWVELRPKHGPVLLFQTSEQNLSDRIRFFTGDEKIQSLTQLMKTYEVKKGKSRYWIPYRHLSPLFRRLLLQTLWPKDRFENNHWLHVITHGSQENLWSISGWFTGNPRNYQAIKKANNLQHDRLYPGQTLKIPQSLLLPFLIPQTLEPIRPQDPVTLQSTPVLPETESIKSDDPVPVPTTPTNVKEQKAKKKH
jgi:hypothetical protein